MAFPLTEATIDRMSRAFPLNDLELVSTLLVEDCGDNLPLGKSATPAEVERIRFAVLKLSDGDLNRLQQALDLAKADWRDVLVAAGFGSDPAVHKSWWPVPRAR